MKTLLFLLTSTFYCSWLCAQTDTTVTDTTRNVYKGLSIKKYYAANTSSSHDVIANCKPCILLFYDSNGKLLSKSIKYTDAIVGYYIEYHPNGKVKLIGHYKENPTDDWNNLWDRGYGRKDGVFTYFGADGKKLYAEYWQNGQFIKQSPEQRKTEI
jgi:hypothetical protein